MHLLRGGEGGRELEGRAGVMAFVAVAVLGVIAQEGRGRRLLGHRRPGPACRRPGRRLLLRLLLLWCWLGLRPRITPSERVPRYEINRRVVPCALLPARVREGGVSAFPRAMGGQWEMLNAPLGWQIHRFWWRHLPQGDHAARSTPLGGPARGMQAVLCLFTDFMALHFLLTSLAPRCPLLAWLPGGAEVHRPGKWVL